MRLLLRVIYLLTAKLPNLPVIWHTLLTVRLTIVPNFSKWLLSFVIVFDSRGIFLTIRVSDG